jgi:two-component system, OmpR family, phosphate regulon sensor histidine kinase PhoR
MNSRAYKIIFILLSFCVFSVLALQGFWIRNFYLQKLEQFNGTVYAALDEISNKLNERESLGLLKEQIVIIKDREDTITVNTTNKKEGFASLPRGQIRINRKENKGGYGVWTDIEAEAKANELNAIKKAIVSSDSVLKHSQKIMEVVEKTTSKTKEMEKLVNKMMTEIKVMEVAPAISDTSLAKLIKEALDNKGIFTPFEFALKKTIMGKEQMLVCSPGYQPAEISYKTDLSSDKIFKTNDFLYLQFSKQTNLVLAGMKGSLFLSLLFSLLVLGVFYYTMRFILKQKKLIEIKNDFVNNMTHELKTPIATISLAVDAINNPIIRNDEEKFSDYSRILKEENQKLNGHVERVLQLSLLEKGELQLHKTEVDLNKLIRSVIDSYKLRINEQKAQVNFMQAENNLVLQGDEHHLRAVFSNLLDNALKYASSDCKIDITILKHEQEIVIIFKDNGIGIAADHHQKVFEKFYREQGGNLHDVKGFGLGLSYVKSIVEAHNGVIELHSEKGKGSEFIIRIQNSRFKGSSIN